MNQPSHETDSSPALAGAQTRLARVWHQPSGLRGWFTTVNYQPLGRRYMITSLMFFVIGGVLSLLIRGQLTVAENDLLGPDAFNEIFTMHGSTMMYLFAVPFIEGLAIYFVPLMIGARDVAFPRLSSFGYWLYLSGGLMMYATFIVGQVPDAGWFAYTPLSGSQYSGIGLDFWLLGLGLVEIAGLSAAAEIVVAILKMRAPGMAIHRMPLLVWSFLIAGVMIIFGFTPLLIATLMLELDRTAGFRFFDPDHGGSSLLWQHLFWFFGHPEVYIIFIPATGVVSTIIPSFARRPIVAYTLIVVALVSTGFVSFGLWVHHMFTTGIPQLSMVFFAGASFMIAVASGTQIFAWIATLWGSRPRYDTPLLYILGFFFIFIVGGMTGVMVATIPFDWQVHDTYFVVAHFHYVLIGGAVLPIFAGLYYWLPKVSGRMPIEPWGKIGFWLVFAGFNVTFSPMHIMGFFGMPRRVYTYPAELNLDMLNIIATVGAAIVGAGFALALVNIAHSAWRGRDAEENPWGAGTLEWSIPSPPPMYSFLCPPIVRSLYPLWRNLGHIARAGEFEAMASALEGRPAGWRATLVSDVLNGRPQALQRLPGPTPLPFITAMGLVVGASAVLAKAYLVAIVAGLFVVGMILFWVRGDRTLPQPEADDLQARLQLPLRPTSTRSVAWWGVLCLVAILTTALGALVYSYFYLWLYSEAWPQEGLPLPAPGIPIAAAGTMIASAAALAWASWNLRRGSDEKVAIGLGGVLALGLVSLVLGILALSRTPFLPSVNAYASAFHALSGFSLLITAAGLVIVAVALYDTLYGDPPQRRLAVELAELFWAFAAVAAIVVFMVTQVSPYSF